MVCQGMRELLIPVFRGGESSYGIADPLSAGLRGRRFVMESSIPVYEVLRDAGFTAERSMHVDHTLMCGCRGRGMRKPDAQEAEHPAFAIDVETPRGAISCACGAAR